MARATTDRREPGRKPGREPRREGAIAVFVAIALVVFLGMAAISVDVSHVYKVRTELQSVADAAAHAAAARLDGSANGLAVARQQAVDIGAASTAHGGGVTILEDDVVFGRWTLANPTFTVIPSPEDNPGAVNAVRVRTRADDQAGSPVTAPFGSIIGHGSTDVGAIAAAVGGGQGQACGFPMVVPQCQLTGVDGDTCQFCFTFQNATSDTAGWSALGLGNGNGVTDIADVLRSACFTVDGQPAIDDTTRQCAGSCGEVNIDENVQVNNGNGIISAGNAGGGNSGGGNSGGGNSGGGNSGGGNSGGNTSFQQKKPCELIQDLLMRNGTPEYFTVEVPTLAGGGEGCSFNFSGWHQIEGFARVDIFGVDCGNETGAGQIIDTSHPGADTAGACGTPSGVFINGALNCDATTTDIGAGGFGQNTIGSVRIRLVE